jgi:ABC-type transporter Mla MlaB component
MSGFNLDQVATNKFAISGSVTFNSGRDLAMLGIAKFKGLKTVQIDCSKITTIDSAVLAVLIAWHRFFKTNNIEFSLSGCKDNLRVLLKSYHVADLFIFYD